MPLGQSCKDGELNLSQSLQLPKKIYLPLFILQNHQKVVFVFCLQFMIVIYRRVGLLGTYSAVPKREPFDLTLLFHTKEFGIIL